MSFRVTFDPVAASEYRETKAWYQDRVDGLGLRFAHVMNDVIATIAAQPLRFPKVGKSSRKARVSGWPYSIYFTLDERRSVVTVTALWHGARNPAELGRRLE